MEEDEGPDREPNNENEKANWKNWAQWGECISEFYIGDGEEHCKANVEVALNEATDYDTKEEHPADEVIDLFYTIKMNHSKGYIIDFVASFLSSNKHMRIHKMPPTNTTTIPTFLNTLDDCMPICCKFPCILLI